MEILIIDNGSVDDTKNSLRIKFPEIKWVFNQTNSGFAKANNQALADARGEYILFLNPDTIIPENFFDEVVRFMETHPQAGACGVRMIDGVGCFLRESKRGFPTTWVAFCKMTGLSSAFKKSKIFSGYYLGHLSENEIQSVEALSGACFFVRSSVLRECGGFDDRFFMYAEDIDLSYSIRQKGWTNYYLPSPVIIHFKGESTIKDKNYIRIFYKAMHQFLAKHNIEKSGLATYLMRLAVSIKTNLDASFVHFRKRKSEYKSHAKPLEFVVLGDEVSCRKVKSMLVAETSTNQDTKNEKEIVLCEGDEYTFRMMITLISSMPGQKYWFHSKESDAIVSSHNKNEKGVAIPLIKKDNGRD